LTEIFPADVSRDAHPLILPMACPALAPEWSPPSTVLTPPTRTRSMPVGNRLGSS
jgi:hypothetical protein